MNEIQTVKIQGSGWLLNNVMHVPGNAPGNKEYELIKQWLSEGNIPEPEFTEEELAKQESDRQIEEAKAYLTDTGWIWEKYNRNVLVLKDMSNEEFNLKYSDVISKQEEYRALINELEVQLEVTNG